MKVLNQRVFTTDSGSALYMSLLCLLAVAGISAALVTSAVASKKENDSSVKRTKALYVAQAGVGQALVQLRAGAPVSMGTAGAPSDFAGGHFWGNVVDNHDNTYTVTSYGHDGQARRGIQAVITRSGGGIYQNAMFAGNSSGDPNYHMGFGGFGAQADAVTGDIYSGGGLAFVGTSTILGTPRAHGSITVQPGTILPGPDGTSPAPQTNVTEPIPDIAGMNYPVNNDVNVANEFAAHSTYQNNASYGGRAWQLPQSNPAHIFRKNPTDRAAITGTTVKEDYFLEDPYQTFHSDPNSNGTDAPLIVLSPGGNNKVYYIDGNLWIDNLSTMSFMIQSAGAGGTQITFVVKGNLYISDNIFMQNPANDGVAFIAIKDSAVHDSGNVYFGDPTFGTLEEMHAFIYAENNFYDNNLSATGSARVRLVGNMTAGNQVNINRDVGHQHSKLTVNFDDRIANGSLTLPGLPHSSGADAAYAVSMMREIAAQ
jgi:hypothetical protein